MTVLGKHDKQPAEVKDYPVDYTDWLGEIASGDSLMDADGAVTCTTTPADAALLVDRIDVSAAGLVVWLSGGTAGQTYKVTVLVQTTGGRTDEIELVVRVKDY